MKPYRSKRRPGNRPMNATEAARVEQAKTTQCIPCLVWSEAGNMPIDDVATSSGYDHAKSGNIRRGHMFGFASCNWHHQRIKPDNWTFAQMTAHFGPSLMDGSRRFAETYGSDDELIQRQTAVLAGEWER